MFKSLDLSVIVEFILMFYRDKPIDWLLDHILWVKVCNPEKDAVSRACAEAGGVVEQAASFRDCVGDRVPDRRRLCCWLEEFLSSAPVCHPPSTEALRPAEGQPADPLQAFPLPARGHPLLTGGQDPETEGGQCRTGAGRAQQSPGRARARRRQGSPGPTRAPLSLRH